MNEIIITWIIGPLIGAVAGGFGGWIFGRKRQQIEIIDAATGTFNKIIEQLRKEVTVYVEEKNQNAELIRTQSKQIEELSIRVHKLSEEVESLRREKKENVYLRKKIEKYEKILVTHNIEF